MLGTGSVSLSDFVIFACISGDILKLEPEMKHEIHLCLTYTLQPWPEDTSVGYFVRSGFLQFTKVAVFSL
jgi:hypothetical protein